MAMLTKRLFLALVSLSFFFALITEGHAAQCEKQDSLSWIDGKEHCFALKTFIAPAGGQSDTLAIILHGDLSGGGVADYIFPVAALATKLGARSVVMMRPGYRGDGRESSGYPTRNQDRDERYNANEIDSIAEAIRRLKKHHGAKRVVLIGHSGGAVIAGVLLGRATPLIDAVVLIACPCHVPDWREMNNWPPLESAESPHTYLDKVAKTARIVAVSGENDGNVGIQLPRIYIEKAVGMGLAAKAIIVPEVGHSIKERYVQSPGLSDAIRWALGGT